MKNGAAHLQSWTTLALVAGPAVPNYKKYNHVKQRVFCMKSFRVGMGLFMAALITTPAFADLLTGTVRDASGKSLQGVLIRMTDRVSGISECVYTNAQGKYKLATGLRPTLWGFIRQCRKFGSMGT